MNEYVWKQVFRNMIAILFNVSFSKNITCLSKLQKTRLINFCSLILLILAMSLSVPMIWLKSGVEINFCGH